MDTKQGSSFNFRSIFLVLVGTGVLAAVVFCLDILLFTYSPGESPAIIFTLEVPPGSNLTTVTRHLQENKIIRNDKKFILLATLMRASGNIQAGEYQFSNVMTPLQILNKLVSGDTLRHQVTIPEGYNMYQIADLLHQKIEVDPGKFLRAALDSRLLAELGIKAKSMEGYLFPDTYSFSKGITEKAIIYNLVNNFRKMITEEMMDKASSREMTLHEVVTLASLIEKETSDGKERPLISGVFHNRLARKMRLETDPTVIYGLKNFNGNLTRKDLQSYTPYNTYRIRGLPPGPIANPGLKSIMAALYPEPSDYLFFVSKNDGTHYFSATLKEHNKAVKRYQKNRSRK